MNTPVIEFLNAEKALELLRVVVEGNENKVYVAENMYDGCSYTHSDSVGDPIPGCLIGHALIKAGLPANVFNELEINSNSGVYIALPRLVEEGYIGSYSRAAREVWSMAQGTQDNDSPWGLALEHAEIRYAADKEHYGEEYDRPLSEDEM